MKKVLTIGYQQYIIKTENKDRRNKTWHGIMEHLVVDTREE